MRTTQLWASPTTRKPFWTRLLEGGPEAERKHRPEQPGPHPAPDRRWCGSHDPDDVLDEFRAMPCAAPFVPSSGLHSPSSCKKNLVYGRRAVPGCARLAEKVIAGRGAGDRPTSAGGSSRLRRRSIWASARCMSNAKGAEFKLRRGFRRAGREGRQRSRTRASRVCRRECSRATEARWKSPAAARTWDRRADGLMSACLDRPGDAGCARLSCRRPAARTGGRAGRGSAAGG